MTRHKDKSFCGLQPGACPSQKVRRKITDKMRLDWLLQEIDWYTRLSIDKEIRASRRAKSKVDPLNAPVEVELP